MFSKGVVLIFLLLGLSSSIAHAIPHQNRAVESNPCDDTATGQKSPPVLVSSDVSKNTTTDKGSDASKLGNGSKTTLTGTGNDKNGANPQGNGKNGTSVNDNGKKDTNPQAQLSNGANPQDGGDNKNSTGNNNDPNTSLCLDQSVLSKGSESNGLNNATNGTSASLTSTNNFINFCATTGKSITNGQQIKGGSCNPNPMGTIPSVDNMPSSKYVFPKNFDTLKANTSFTMQVAVKNAQLGVFTNADTTYFSAPQQLNNQGQIIGHTHLVVEQVPSLQSTTPLNPQIFAFFKGIDGPLADGTVSAAVPNGLPEGVYRFMTIGTSSNHVPWAVPIAQHGSLEDAVYATITADGNPDSGNNPDTGNNNNTTSGDTNPKTGANGKGDKTAGKVTGATNSTATDKSAGIASKSATDKGNKRRAFSLEYRKD